MASLHFLGTTTDGHEAHNIDCGDSNTTLESTHNSLEDDRVPTVVVDGKTKVTNDDGHEQDAEHVPVLHEDAELAQVYQDMPVEDAQIVREPHDYFETLGQPSSTEDTRSFTERLPLEDHVQTVGTNEAIAGHAANQAASHSVHGFFTEEVSAVNDAVVVANGVDGVQRSQADQGGRLHAPHFTVTQNAAEPAGAMQQYNFMDGDMFVFHAHGHSFIVHVRALVVESAVYLHFTLVLLGGQYTTLNTFTGHDHLASDLGFVFGGYNDSGASAFPSDIGAVFGNEADNAFGRAHEDGGIFESDLNFVFDS